MIPFGSGSERKTRVLDPDPYGHFWDPGSAWKLMRIRNTVTALEISLLSQWRTHVCMRGRAKSGISVNTSKQHFLKRGSEKWKTSGRFTVTDKKLFFFTPVPKPQDQKTLFPMTLSLKITGSKLKKKSILVLFAILKFMYHVRVILNRIRNPHPSLIRFPQ